MSIYRYAMGGGTELPMMGGPAGGAAEEPTGKPIEEQVEEMKSKIKSALEGGASDKEIMMMVQDSGLQDKYEFNWDSVEMKVEAYPIEDKAASAAGAGVGALLQKLKSIREGGDDRFGEPDKPGQRSDNFGDGGKSKNKYDKDVNDLLNLLENMGSSEGETWDSVQQAFDDLIKNSRTRRQIENIIGKDISNMSYRDIQSELMKSRGSIGEQLSSALGSGAISDQDITKFSYLLDQLDSSSRLIGDTQSDIDRVEDRALRNKSLKDLHYKLSKLNRSSKPNEDDRFGPIDPPGQRGDMFGGGGTTEGKTADQLIKEYEAILNRTGVSDEARAKYSAKISKLRAAERNTGKMKEGGRTFQHESEDDQGGKVRTYAGQYMGKVMQDEGGKYGVYDDGEGNKTKVYFAEDPGKVGEYVPDDDYFFFVNVNGKTVAKKAPGFAAGGKTYKYGQ